MKQHHRIGSLCAISAVALSLVAGVACANGQVAEGGPRASASAPDARPSFQKVFIVVMENTAERHAKAQPYLAALAQRGAYLANMYAITHPSYPNYIAMTAGSMHGVRGDGQVTIDVRHIGDLLEARGKTWRVYAEGYPGHCFLGTTRGAYARRHVPFLSYRNVTSNPARCANVVPASQLQADISEGRLADYSLFIPNNSSNGHDTGPVYGARWLEQAFGSLLQDRRFMNGMLFALTYDEDNGSQRNQIYTVLLGDSVIPGSRVESRTTLYSLMRLVEDGFGLGNLGANDATAEPITGIWR